MKKVEVRELLYAHMIGVILPPKFEWYSSKNEVGRMKLVRVAKIANFVIF